MKWYSRRRCSHIPFISSMYRRRVGKIKTLTIWFSVLLLVSLFLLLGYLAYTHSIFMIAVIYDGNSGKFEAVFLQNDSSIAFNLYRTSKMNREIKSQTSIKVTQNGFISTRTFSDVTTAITKASSTAKNVTSTTKNVTSLVEKRTKFYVCPEPTNGGIGNLMFEFASSYAIAKSKNMTVLVSPKYGLSKLFSIKAEKSNASKEICQKASGRRAAFHIRYDGNLTDFEPDRDYRIGIYLQSWKYFDDIADDIREQYQFKSSVRTKADEVINNTITKHKFSSRSGVVLVGIHIRRGDFVNNKFGYNVATPKYLRKAVNYFTQRYINVLFIVCTNDMKWTKENMPLSAITVDYTQKNTPEVDMCILNMCDHTIISVGTFGWWAAWLNNNGKTIYFKWPAIEGSKLRAHFSKDYSDFFPPSWIGM